MERIEFADETFDCVCEYLAMWDLSKRGRSQEEAGQVSSGSNWKDAFRGVAPPHRKKRM